MAPKGEEKPQPSALQPAIAMEDLFTALNRHINRSKFNQAIKVADQVLAIAPGDDDAIRCKIVAFVKDDTIYEALLTINEYSRKFQMISAFSR
ncbi:unnamed protein product [Ilex paraguariensis]|uniref:Uncharacterized protein n=1 Tax=Ilex paraguariensis TaxID=185542 RepID=A0ABC8V2J0_9AQUA